MASNIQKEYKDKTPSKRLDNKTLNKMVLRSCNLQGSFNMERMQANGWLHSILPGLEKIHTNKEDLATSMAHNLEFFNTHPFLVTFVMGIVLSLEEQKADVETIRAVRVAAMGPLGGIGDALFWLTLVPITAGITANMAINGSILGPILFLLIFNVVQFAMRFGLMKFSYNFGSKAISMLTQNSREFMRSASMLGIFIVGALTSNYGGTATHFAIKNGTKIVDKKEVANYIDIQAILDGILPKLIPLLLVLLLYRLFAKRGWKPIHGIILLFFIALIGVLVGFWAGDYKSPFEFFNQFRVQ